MRVQALSSGSRGNLTYLEIGGFKFLVDLGISCKECERRMTEAGIDPTSIDAIFITHEHADHVNGVSVFSRRYKTPAYISKKAWQRFSRREPNWFKVELFEPEQKFNFETVEIHPISIKHDTADPVAFTFTSEKHKFGIATDLGCFSDKVVGALKRCHILLVESNHDEHMLHSGPYPYYLKKRVASKHGHLSNIQSSQLLHRLIHPKLHAVILGHLSEKNNLPELAYQQNEKVLINAPHKIPLLIASQDHPTPPIELK